MKASGVVTLGLALTSFLFLKPPRAAEGDIPSGQLVSTAYRSGQATATESLRNSTELKTAAVNGDQGPETSRSSETRVVMQRVLQTLSHGVQEFGQKPGYQAKFFKQELVNGSLREEEEIDLKLAHSPFSVYMKWRAGETGQQAIYVDGENDNQLLVQPGGFKGRLAGTLKIDPASDRAMDCSRYPITNVGMVELGKIISDTLAMDLENNAAATCELTENAEFESRPCFRYTALYATPQSGHPYRRVELLIDKEYSLPVWVRNHGWGEEGAEVSDDDSLIEFYCYKEIEVNEAVSDQDFDPTNRKYAMRMK